MSILLSKNEQITRVFNNVKGLIPQDVLISCPDWAEKNRYMTQKISRKIGKFSFSIEYSQLID